MDFNRKDKTFCKLFPQFLGDKKAEKEEKMEQDSATGSSSEKEGLVQQVQTKNMTQRSLSDEEIDKLPRVASPKPFFSMNCLMFLFLALILSILLITVYL